jgi:hypothetical protein
VGEQKRKGYRMLCGQRVVHGRTLSQFLASSKNTQRSILPIGMSPFFRGKRGHAFRSDSHIVVQGSVPFRKQLIEDFCLRFRKFETPPCLSPLMDAPLCYQGYAKFRASSRRYQVYDAEDCWTPATSFEMRPEPEKGSSSLHTGSGGPAPG